jgi:triacylglycerol lipase
MRIAMALALGLAMLSGCAADAASEGTDVEDATEAAPLGPEPKGVPARYAIVLAHGFDASPTNRWGFHGVAEALRADGHTVYVAQVPPYQSVANRAAVLSTYVEKALDDGFTKVNIIAHSMGGLDSRYLVATLGYGDVVASVTSISSPHRGTAVADLALKVLGKGGGASDKVLNGLASAWGLSFNQLAGSSDVRAALSSLSEANSAAFNAANPDDARVYYQSWAGVSSILGIKRSADMAACGTILGDYRVADMVHPTLVPLTAVVAHIDMRPNDGMATVAGAKWGKFRGCIPADHLDEVGYPNSNKPDPRTRFSHVRFYRNIAFELAARGY